MLREQDLHAEVFEVLLGLAFYGGGGADGHEGGSVNDAVRRGEAAEARAGGIGGEDFKLEILLEATPFERVYQENTAVTPTLMAMNKIHGMITRTKALPNESFLGLVAL